MDLTKSEEDTIKRIKNNSMDFRKFFIDSMEHHKRQYERILLILNEADR